MTTLRAPEETPPGTRTFDVVAFGWLVVQLGQKARRVGDVVSSVRRWLTAGDAAGRTVRLEIDGDVLELSGATAEDQQRLIDVFVQRHAAGHDES